MPDVVYFDRVRQDDGAPISFAYKNAKACCLNPIVVERQSMKSVSIGFHKSFFNLPFLENALQGLAFGEMWDLYRFTDEPKSAYTTFLIELQRSFGSKTDDMLTTIVDRITRRVYLEEISAWSNEVEISDLMKPHQYSIGDGANIRAETKTKLSKAGVNTVRELTHLTREELCRVPGMTTDEVVRLEKSLASRGIFLMSGVPV